MKRMRKIMLAVLCLMTAMCVMLTGAKVKAEEYTYTLTFSGGLYGTADTTTESSLAYEENVDIDSFTVTVTNDKYVFLGWHPAGQEEVKHGNVTVENDMDFVAAYALKDSVVAYTVNYQDADGGDLLPSKTFYGSVGDKPVVGFVYVEGYEPQAYNLTKTLSDNAADNVFTFTYTEVEAIIEEETTGGGGGGTGGGAGGAGGAGGTGGTGAGGTGEGTEPENQGTVIPENPTPGGPADTIDLDDNDAPKTPGGAGGAGGNGGSGGSGGNGGSGEKKGLSKGAAIGIAAGGAAVLVGAGVLIALAVAKRRRDD